MFINCAFVLGIYGFQNLRRYLSDESMVKKWAQYGYNFNINDWTMRTSGGAPQQDNGYVYDGGQHILFMDGYNVSCFIFYQIWLWVVCLLQCVVFESTWLHSAKALLQRSRHAIFAKTDDFRYSALVYIIYNAVVCPYRWLFIDHFSELYLETFYPNIIFIRHTPLLPHNFFVVK